MPKRIPAELFPPGEYLKDELEARGWSQSEFAEIIGRDTASVNRIISGKSQITLEMARLLEDALELDAQYWINLETGYQLAKSRERSSSDNVSRKARLHDKFPVKQIMARGWIAPTDSLDVLYHRIFDFFGVSDIDDTPSFMHAAKKKKKDKITPLQNAWLFRTYQLAQSLMASNFTKRRLDSALVELKNALEAPEEIRTIPRILAGAGVRLVVVEPLKGSQIDGACYWLDDRSPVVALSLLHPSIDCFWFDLIHELFHIANGHGKGNGPILDENLRSNTDDQESEEERLVNREAEEWLIECASFDDFVMRYNPIFSRANVLGFARRIQVHPGIVAGRLHKKGIIKNWAIHGRLKTNVRNMVASTVLCDGWGVSPQI